MRTEMAFYLIVEKTGAKRWLLRIVVKGRRRDIGLGGIRDVSLAEAREKALELRTIVRSGGDPVADKRAQKQIPTFADAANLVHMEHKASWENKKHTQQWIRTLEAYVIPIIGNKLVDQIDTPDVLKVLSPIWMTKSKTAGRVRQRIGRVLDWARAAGFRSGENPVDGVLQGLPKQISQVKHHPALPFRETPDFIATQLASASSSPAKLAFELLILTATRTKELLDLPWSEIDRDVWILPAERTKTKREIYIPLGPRCLEILKQARTFSGSGHYVFPGNAAGKPLSNMVFLEALKRMGLNGKVTAHGFRSTFTDWAHETTNFQRVVIEMALNHSIKDKTEAAYRRGGLFNKRRELMLAWENFCCSSLPTQSETTDETPATRDNPVI
jgi:integrase